MRSITSLTLFYIPLLFFIGLFHSNQGYCNGNCIFRHNAEVLKDDTQMLQNRINSEQILDLGDTTATYTINGTLFLKSNQYVFGNKAKIIQRGINKAIFNCKDQKNIKISGLVLVGKGDDYTPTSTSESVGIYCWGTYNLEIWNTEFYNFSYSPVSGLRNVNMVYFHHNICQGTGNNNPLYYQKDHTGITLGGKNIKITDNKITNSSQGIIIAEGSDTILIQNNFIFDIPLEHGIYIDTSCSNLIIDHNEINNVGGCGMKVQNRNFPISFCRNIHITNNTITGTKTGDGILVNNSEGKLFYAENVLIEKNILKNIGQHGINVRFSKNTKVVGNVISGVQHIGFYLSGNYDLTLFNNTTENTMECGLFDDGTGERILIDSNRFIHPGLAKNDTNGLSSGIFIEGGKFRTLRKNYVKGDDTNTQYALYIANGDQASISITDNVLIGARDYGARFSDKGKPFKSFRGNQAESKLGKNSYLNQPKN